MRYAGQSFELTVPLGADVAESFHQAHQDRYGYADRARALSSSPYGPPTSVPARHTPSSTHITSCRRHGDGGTGRGDSLDRQAGAPSGATAPSW